MKMRMFVIVGLACLAAGTVSAQNGLSVPANGDCSMNGTNYGLEVHLVPGDTQIVYVEDQTPANETVYRASFWFNPNAISMGATQRFPIFLVRNDSFQNILRLQLHRNAANNKYRLRLQVLKNNGDWANAREFDATGADFLPIGDGSIERLVTVEVVYGDNLTSQIRLTANGMTFTKTAYWSTNWSVDHVRMGATRNLGSGTYSGDMCFDEFESFRTLAP